MKQDGGEGGGGRKRGYKEAGSIESIFKFGSENLQPRMSSESDEDYFYRGRRRKRESESR